MVDEYLYFKHYYPKYFEKFSIRFEEFLNEWKEIAKNSGELEDKRDYLTGFTTKHLYLIVHQSKSNLRLVKRYEAGDKKLTRDEKAVLEYFIEEVLFVPDVLMRTFSRSNKVYNFTKLKLIKELEEQENKRGKYDKKIFKRAFELQVENNDQRPRLTNRDAIYKAMIELGADSKNLLLADKPTHYLMSVVFSYENHHKKNLKEKAKKPKSILVSTKIKK